MKRAGRGLVTITCIMGLLVAACGGSSDDDATPASDRADADVAASEQAAEPRTVTSDDGNVIVEIPASAADIDVEVRLLDPADYPEELQGAEVRGGLYELLPDRATFDEPVRVTRVLDPEAIGLADNEVASMIMATRSSSGEWSLLDDVVIDRTPDEYTVSGSTAHFSTLAAFRGQVTLELDPLSVAIPVDEEFGATVTLTRGSSVVELDETAWSATEPLRLLGPPISRGRFNKYACGDPGTGRYTVTVSIEEDLPTAVLVLLPIGKQAFDITLTGLATCTDLEDDESPPPTPSGAPFDIVSACARVIDEPFLEFPVTVEVWIFLQDADGAEGSLTVTGLHGDQPVSAAVSNGAAIFRLGLRDTGVKTVTGLDLARPGAEPADVTEQVAALVGSPFDIQDPSFESGNGC